MKICFPNPVWIQSSISKIVSTGYGRNSVKFADKTFTEIMAHAAGAYFLNPKIRTIIDIGGQDSKAMALDEKGKVKNFVMNDKCAAGTGRFLEVMARALEVNLDEFGAMSLQSKLPSKISSLCTVFAESEVISLIARGEKRPDIIAGIHESIAARVSSMLARVGVAEPVMITGGVARNAGVVDALDEETWRKNRGVFLCAGQRSDRRGCSGLISLIFIRFHINS